MKPKDGIDPWGGDLWDDVVSTRKECEKICLMSNVCNKYVFGGTEQTGNCYLKNGNVTRLEWTTGHMKSISGFRNSDLKRCKSEG